MKCPKCENSQKYIYGMTCLNCKYEFVLNPKTSGSSDYRFNKVVQVVSEEGTKYYTFNQFYNVYANYKGPLVMILLFLLSLVFVALAAAGIIEWSLGIVGAVGSGIFALTKTPEPIPTKSSVLNNFTAYKAANGLPFHLDKPQMQTAPNDFSAATMIEHGTEGIVFVDQDIYVDLFIKNKIHQDLKSIVVAQSGYPKYLTIPIAEMYEKHPNIKVYMLHDSNTDTHKMREKIKVWLNNSNVEIIDLGMSPDAKTNIKVFKKYKKDEAVYVDYLRPNTLSETLTSAVMTGIAMDLAYQSIYGQSRGFIDDFG